MESVSHFEEGVRAVRIDVEQTPGRSLDRRVHVFRHLSHGLRLKGPWTNKAQRFADLYRSVKHFVPKIIISRVGIPTY